MLKVDPKERIKASEILKHPYIAGYGADNTSEKEILSPASTINSAKAINFSEAEKHF
jgi:hypothetical protein